MACAITTKAKRSTIHPTPTTHRNDRKSEDGQNALANPNKKLPTHQPDEVQYATRGLSCGWATRAGSVANPRAWAYSSQPTVNRGLTESAWATMVLMLSGLCARLRYVPDRPKSSLVQSRWVQIGYITVRVSQAS